MVDPKVIVALDYSNKKQVESLVTQLDPKLCRVKVGKELFTRQGPNIIEFLHQKNFTVFLDLKFHDIPNTVAQAVRAAADMNVWMVNVHALGGRKMLLAAKDALANYTNPPKLIAVTILTSLQQQDLQEIGLTSSFNECVSRLAQLTYDCELDGVVCSAQEAKYLRQSFGKQFCLVTPGIRLPDDPYQDQQRVATPAQAIANGADYLVIGRSVTQAKYPMEALQKVINYLQNPLDKHFIS